MLQVSRLLARDGFTEEHAAARIASQMPLADRMKLADLVIDNDGDLDQLENNVQQVMHKIQQGSALWGILSSPVCAVVLPLVCLVRLLR